MADPKPMDNEEYWLAKIAGKAPSTPEPTIVANNKEYWLKYIAENGGGGGGGTSDYNGLSNLPKINGTELKGSLTSANLGLQSTLSSGQMNTVNSGMTAEDKTKLNGIDAGATKTTVDTALSSTSTNPLQNKAINTALNAKAATSAVLTKTNTTAFTPTGDYQPAPKKYVDDNAKLDAVLTKGNTATNKTMTLTNDEDETGGFADVVAIKSTDGKRSAIFRPSGTDIEWKDEIVNPQDPSDVREIGARWYMLDGDIYVDKKYMSFGNYCIYSGIFSPDHINFSGMDETDPSDPKPLNHFSMDWGETASVGMSDGLKEAWRSALGMDEIILTSPNNNKFRLKVANDGTLSTEQVVSQ